jgi:hypothetical protein
MAAVEKWQDLEKRRGRYYTLLARQVQFTEKTPKSIFRTRRDSGENGLPLLGADRLASGEARENVH